MQRPAQTPPSGYGLNAFVCSLEVESFDEIADKIMQGGGQVAMEKFPVRQMLAGIPSTPKAIPLENLEVDEKAGLV